MTPATFRAYLGTTAEGHVRVCAWCPDAAALTATVTAAGGTCTHGMCRPHFVAQRTQFATKAKAAGVAQHWRAA